MHEQDSHGDTTGHANEGICILYARLMTTSTLPFRLKYAKRNLPHYSSRATCTNVYYLVVDFFYFKPRVLGCLLFLLRN